MKNFAQSASLLLFLVACSPSSNRAYTPLIDLTPPGGSLLQTECQNAQDSASIPSVSYATAATYSLGAVKLLAASNTDFRFYAPASTTVDLLIYGASTTAVDAPTSTIAMTKDGNGVFSVNVAAGSSPVGTYYRYRVNCMKVYAGGAPMKEFQRYIPDPYARAQAGSSGHSIVGVSNDLYAWGAAETTWFSGGAGRRQNTKDYIVYELHLGDITGDDSCATSGCANDGFNAAVSLTSNSNRGKFKGLQDMISYLQNLGVNAVQLMPVHEYSVDSGNSEGYSWGYLPSSFFAPESSYASNSTNASAITELKDLVKALHTAKIAVILDVVLTHTANYYNYLYFIDPFNRSYFRLNGTAWANLGTGNWINDDKTTNPFAHKLVRDNIRYWAQNYHVDGFRFDLIVGTLKNTILDIQKDMCNPNGAGVCAATPFQDNQGVTIKHPNFWTGENWLGATRHDFLLQSNTAYAAGVEPLISFSTVRDTDYIGFSQWNDYFRESVKSFINGNSDIQTTNRMRTAIYFSQNRDDGIWQGKPLNPVDTLNYLESHDEQSVANAVLGNQLKAAMGYAILMTSHGIPMVQQGQEFMRDKGIQDQSMLGNSLKWYQLTANRPFFHFASYMTKIRKACPALRYGTDPGAGNSNFDTSADNQMYSLFTKSGTVCAGSGANVLDGNGGRTEFRILANMNSYSKTFTVETGGSKWCLLAQVSDSDANMSTSPATFYLNTNIAIPNITQVSGYGPTTNTWSLSPYTFLILTKITGGGNCSAP